MQNSGAILKVEYKFNESDEFAEIPFTNGTGNFIESFSHTKGGGMFALNVKFSIAKNSAATESPVKDLLFRKAIYRVTDGNYTTYTLGNDELKARAKMKREIAGSAGGKNIRTVEISYKSQTGVTIT